MSAQQVTLTHRNVVSKFPTKFALAVAALRKLRHQPPAQIKYARLLFPDKEDAVVSGTALTKSARVVPGENDRDDFFVAVVGVA